MASSGKKSINILLYVIILSVCLPYYSMASNFGTNTAEFLKINPDAASAAMGETGLGLADATSALHLNPAGLAFIDRGEVNISELLWFNSIHMEYGAVAFPIDEEGTAAGFSLLWIDFGSFDSTGGLAEAVNVQNAMVNAAFAKAIGDISLGVNARGIYENFLDEISFGASFDLGAQWQLIERGLFIGANIKNLGFVAGSSDMLPVEAGAGLGIKFYQGAFDFANIAVDFNKIVNTDNIFAAAGVEYTLFKAVSLRLGFKYNNALDMENLFKDIQNMMLFSGGIGIIIGDTFVLDYAFTPMGDIGNVQRVALKFRFGDSIYENKLAEKKARIIPKAMEVPQMRSEEGQIKAVTFKPSLPEENVKEWKLNIKTSDGKIVKSFTGVGEVPKNLTWDGTDNLGKIATSDANYVFDFKVKSTEGQIVKTEGKIAAIKKFDFMPVEEKKFVPEKSREMLVAPLTLLVSSDANERREAPFVITNDKIKKVKEWTFTVYDKNNNAIKMFSGKGDIPSYLVWDGKDVGGQYVSDLTSCTYVLDLTGTDGKKAAITNRKVLREAFSITSKEKKLKVTKRIYFKEQSYDILGEMQDRVAEIAQEIKDYRNVHVYIQGHAANEGTAAYSTDLSRERAKMVLRWLVEKHAVDPATLSAMGYGDRMPVAENDSDEGRRMNMMVEVIIMGEK
jgi:outer membrane protein OmpA-like peptidoglycan-associated protein